MRVCVSVCGVMNDLIFRERELAGTLSDSGDKVWEVRERSSKVGVRLEHLGTFLLQGGVLIRQSFIIRKLRNLLLSL